MIKLEWLKIIELIKSFIEEGHSVEALVLLDNLYKEIKKNYPAMEKFEIMEVLGILVDCYTEAGIALNNLLFTERGITVLEELCTLALSYIEDLGVGVTDKDIEWTAGDLIRLGCAYVRVNKINKAREVLEKAKELLSKINWEIDVESIIKEEMRKRR